MIEDLLNCCKERVALGQNNLETLVSNLEGLSEREKAQVQYHSECRKSVVNKRKINKLRTKSIDVASPSCSCQEPG